MPTASRPSIRRTIRGEGDANAIAMRWSHASAAPRMRPILDDEAVLTLVGVDAERAESATSTAIRTPPDPQLGGSADRTSPPCAANAAIAGSSSARHLLAANLNRACPVAFNADQTAQLAGVRAEIGPRPVHQTGGGRRSRPSVSG